MPIYEYRCEDCGHELEALQRISDEPLSECPECEQPQLIKLVSAAGFRLKGSGWYETDFKKGNRRNVVDSGEGKSESKANGKAEGKADKSSTKTESSSKSNNTAASAA